MCTWSGPIRPRGRLTNSALHANFHMVCVVGEQSGYPVTHTRKNGICILSVGCSFDIPLCDATKLLDCSTDLTAQRRKACRGSVRVRTYRLSRAQVTWIDSGLSILLNFSKRRVKLTRMKSMAAWPRRAQRSRVMSSHAQHVYACRCSSNLVQIGKFPLHFCARVCK